MEESKTRKRGRRGKEMRREGKETDKRQAAGETRKRGRRGKEG